MKGLIATMMGLALTAAAPPPQASWNIDTATCGDGGREIAIGIRGLFVLTVRAADDSASSI